MWRAIEEDTQQLLASSHTCAHIHTIYNNVFKNTTSACWILYSTIVGRGESYTLCLLFCNPDSYIPGSLQALQCSSNPQTPVSPSFSCTKVRAHWATRKEENLSRFQCMTTCHLAIKVCFHANIQSASFQAEWKPHTRGLQRFDSLLQWLISRCMYAWLFVNMCSFLIFFLKYAVIILGVCKSEGSRCVFAWLY